MSCECCDILLYSKAVFLQSDPTRHGFSESDVINDFSFADNTSYLFHIRDPECETTWNGLTQTTWTGGGIEFTLTAVTGGFKLSAQNTIITGKQAGQALTFAVFDIYEATGTTTSPLSVTANGTYNAPIWHGWSQVTVNVPATFSAADEGRVVSAGTLVSQTSSAVTENGVIDTTLINSLNVNISGGDAEDGIIMRTISGAYENSRVTAIGSSAFAFCSSLTTASFPSATSIGSWAFIGCTDLTTASFPLATSIGESAFTYCRSLETALFPAVTTIGGNAFGSCYSLTTASFPVATTMWNGVFGNCLNLATVSFPAATSIGYGAFASCYSLTTVLFPAATSIGSCAFQFCSSLTTVSLPAAAVIGSWAFHKCVRLTSLYLMGSSVAALSYSNAFSSTPIGGYSASAGQYGSIYVPLSLLSAYRGRPAWSYFSSRFVGVE